MSKRRSLFIKGFWQVADPKIWIASVIPMLTGAAIAWTFGVSNKPLNVIWFLLGMIGVFLVEIAKNALNEVVDYLSGVDPDVDEAHRTPFSGGKKSIVQGRLDLTQCLYIAIGCFFAAAVIGLIIAIVIEPGIFLIGLVGFLLAVLYSLPPFKLCYRGFGEIAVGISFGPLIVMGIYVLIEGRFDLLPFLASLPIMFMITNVLWINQFPDYEVDKAHDKKNWVVRLGKEKAVWGYALLYALSYLAVIGLAAYAWNPIWLLPLLTIPMAVKSVKNCRKNYNSIDKLVASNAATVQIYQLFGVSFIVSTILDGLIF